MDHSISRRTALVGALGGAGALAVAACGTGSGGSSDTSAAGREDPPASSPARTDPAPTGTSAETSDDSGSSDALADLNSITVGEAVAAKLDGKPVLVARPTSTTAACFSAICTHQGCTVAPAGKQLQCPCHGSVYDATTGAVISGPAPRALDKIAVTVEGGEVLPAG